jgi:hypothetical protein
MESETSTPRTRPVTEAPSKKPARQRGDRLDDHFLKRVESARLARECARSIDMRHCSAGPCKCYRHEGRAHWMDEESYAIFIDGLKHNAGVFTNATYEAIVGSSLAPVHTKGDEIAPLYGDYAKTFETAQTTNNLLVQQLREFVDMGYFAKRQELRLRRTISISLIAGDRLIPARTRDISYHGIEVRTIVPAEVKNGALVAISIDGREELKRVKALYRVVRVRHHLHESFLSLRCEGDNPTNPVLRFLRACVDERLQGDGAAQRLDAKNISLIFRAMLAERHYMGSTSVLPFFLKKDASGAVRIEVLLSNNVNKRLAEAFEYAPNRYDFSGLNHPDRTRHLLRLARLGGHVSAFVAVRRNPKRGGVDVVADFDRRRVVKWRAHLASDQQDENVRVFQVLVRRIRRSNEKRLAQAVDPLGHGSQHELREIRELTDGLVAHGALVDITADVRTWNLAPRRAVTTGAPHWEEWRKPPQPTKLPTLLHVKYVEQQRGEERHELLLPVELNIRGRNYSAVALDLSSAGLRLALPAGAPVLEAGEVVDVSFPDFIEQSTVLEKMLRRFVDVSYVVVCGQAGDKSSVRLRLQDRDQNRGVVKSVRGYLESRVSNIRKEISNADQVTLSRLYSSIFVENSPTIPVFFFRTEPGATPIAKVGVTHRSNPLASFFEIEDRKYDFSPITMPTRVASLVDKAIAQRSATMTVFLLKKRVHRQPRYLIHSIADHEFDDEQRRHNFIAQLHLHDFRILRIIATRPTILPAAATEILFEQLRAYSARRAEIMRQEWASLAAVGDVIDISGQIKTLQRVGRKAS